MPVKTKPNAWDTYKPKYEMGPKPKRRDYRTSHWPRPTWLGWRVRNLTGHLALMVKDRLDG